MGKLIRTKIAYNGKEFPAVEVKDKRITCSDIELWHEIKDDYDSGSDEAFLTDCGIFYYFNSGFLASNPSDDEIMAELEANTEIADLPSE